MSEVSLSSQSDPLLIKETWWHSNDVHFKCSEEMMFGDDDVLKI